MPKVKRKSMNDIEDDAWRARDQADARRPGYSTEQAAINLNRGPAKGIDRIPIIGGRFPSEDETSAASMMLNSRAAELERTAARAKGVTNRATAKASQTNRQRGLTGRSSGGITGKGSKNVNPTYNTY